ncbi:unnamed protein product [Moneuplotes crassus]|uniref:Uncharacterized protein n=1 Tax=Euplotes crassus TaxID=5936 RepID=A0AAD1Y973_EUPCR|nr:unnamed protein product [Moneuplotes crassus]
MEEDVVERVPRGVKRLDFTNILQPVKGQLDEYFDNSCKNKPIFSVDPIRFSPDKEQNPQETMLARLKLNKGKMKKYMRNYDINKIREHRIMNSFTVGRKISAKENSDNRINSAIDLLIARETKKADSYLKAGIVTKKEINNIMPKKKIFESDNFGTRTDKFYKSIAEELIQNDIKRENQKRCFGRKGKKGSPKVKFKYANSKKSGVNNDSFHMSMETSTKSIWNLIKPIKLNKKKNKLKKCKKTIILDSIKFSKRMENLTKAKKISQIKRIFGEKYPVDPEADAQELDGILKSPSIRNPKFKLFYSRNRSMDEKSIKVSTPSVKNASCDSSVLEKFLEKKLKDFEASAHKKTNHVAHIPCVNTPSNVKEIFEKTRFPKNKASGKRVSICDDSFLLKLKSNDLVGKNPGSSYVSSSTKAVSSTFWNTFFDSKKSVDAALAL